MILDGTLIEYSVSYIEGKTINQLIDEGKRFTIKRNNENSEDDEYASDD